MLSPMSIKVGSFVRWNSSGGTARGRATMIVTDGNVPNIDVKVTGTEDDPAAQIRIYRPRDDGWEETDTLVGHKVSTLTEIDPLPKPSGDSMKGGDDHLITEDELLDTQAPDPDELDEVFSKYRATVNMSASELERWSENECSKLASVDRSPIRRNLELLRTKKGSWTEKHVRWANRTISFVSRMRGAEQGEPAKEGCPSKRDISLKNWAFDPNKGRDTMTLSAIRDELDKTQQALADITKAMDMLDPIPAMPATDLRMGMPTDEQLSKMNRYRPVGSEPYSADEVVTIPIQASHNLIQLSGLMAWHPRAIAAMARYLVDRPHIVDHEWDEVSGSVGFFYDSQVITATDAKPEEMDMNGAYDLNKDIIDRYGYHRLILHACVQKNSPVVDAYRFRRLGDVSTGNLVYPSYICPLDDKNFEDSDCPYLPPTPWILMLAEAGELSEEEMALIAPYMLRDGVFYGVETSAVVVGNLPGAGVVRAG